MENRTHKNEQERRFISEPIEIRKKEDGTEGRTVSGYALKFNTWSEDLGYFRETINERALEGVDLSNVVATFNHDFSMPMARVNKNTLTLTVDKVGLRFEFEAPDTTYGNDLLANIRNGNVDGCSFMFSIQEQRWTWKDKDDEVDDREILKIKELIELGPVTMPAYRDTTVMVRSRDEMKKEFSETPNPTPSTKMETLDIERRYLETKIQNYLKNS